MIVDASQGTHSWVARFSERFSSGTHPLVRNVTVQLQPGGLLVQGRTESYHAVQLAISSINDLLAHEQLTLPVRLDLRVNGQWFKLVIGGPCGGPSSGAEPVLQSRHCQRELTPQSAAR